MTSLSFYQVDAFADRPFAGNQAAIMPLDEWLPDDVMQAIAAKNNVAETAFLVASDRDDADYDLRWFTPAVEVDLCGHATLASAEIVLGEDAVRFSTRSGILTVERRDGLLWLDMPASRVAPVTAGGEAQALGQPVCGIWGVTGGNGGAIVLLENETAVRAAKPDFAKVAACSNGFIIATAPGDSVDFVSRVFCPTFGIDEDPVTGSAHCALTPFWAERLGKSRLSAFQASSRGGKLQCEMRGDRVLLGGQCVRVIEGRFSL
ncbi:MAG: PhzF family phenazine biosynthesis protein [Sphingomicrobium sp.]